MEQEHDGVFTRTFTVEKQVVLDEVVEYNESGKETYHRYYEGHPQHSRGLEIWHEYDAAGNEVHCKNSDGEETWREYDAAGNEVHCKKSDGEETWHEYDAAGNEVHRKKSDGDECWYDYDAAGKCVHDKIILAGLGQEENWYDYDANGNEIHSRQIDIHSEEHEDWSEYDKNGKRIFWRDSHGLKASHVYDANGNEVYGRNMFGKEAWYEYNEKGQCIRMRRSRNAEETESEKYEYDEGGNHVKRTSDSFVDTPPELFRFFDNDNILKRWHTHAVTEEWFAYNERGQLTYRSDHKGKEEWREYDAAGLEIHRKYRLDPYEEEYWYERAFWENGAIKKLAVYRHYHWNKTKGEPMSMQEIEVKAITSLRNPRRRRNASNLRNYIGDTSPNADTDSGKETLDEPPGQTGRTGAYFSRNEPEERQEETPVPCARNSVRNILYIHGLNGSEHSSTCKNLRAILGDCTVHAATFDLQDIVSTMSKISSLVRKHDIGLVVGSSLGGFYALLSDAAPFRIVINPCMRPSIEIPRLAPEMDAKTIVRLSSLERKFYTDALFDSGERARSTFGIFGTGDELFSYADFFASLYSRRSWNGRNMAFVEGGHHKLTAEELAEPVRAAFRYIEEAEAKTRARALSRQF